MAVITTFRAPLPRETAVDHVKVDELRALAYADYLKTAHWRKTRNSALTRAGWKCGRCQSNVGLQVHHLSYERVGEERDADLEVLCKSCHEGLHFDESRKANIGVYLKLASDCIKQGDWSFSDLTEALYQACRQNGIPRNARAIARAVETVLTNRWKPPTAASAAALKADPRPFTQSEAVDLLRDMGLTVPIRTMPTLRGRIDIYGPVPREDFGEHDRY